MNKVTLLICFLLFGCSGTLDYFTFKDEESNEETIVLITDEEADNDFQQKTVKSYYQQPIIKNVNHYAKWIAQDLFSNLDFPANEDVFVVSDFSLLDSDLDKTNHFGRQLTEALMHEVNRTGFSVIDMKATGFVRISETGDMFFHSKDFRELSRKTSATNIIAGTLTRHQGGYLINARIIAMETNAMVSSAQAFVPFEVVDAVLLEAQPKERKEIKTGIPLKAYSMKP
ncbi:MAG: TolB-like protein [Alteromonadaceae bacterium]|jgi:TolB-like protein